MSIRLYSEKQQKLDTTAEKISRANVIDNKYTMSCNFMKIGSWTL